MNGYKVEDCVSERESEQDEQVRDARRRRRRGAREEEEIKCG